MLIYFENLTIYIYILIDKVKRKSNYILIKFLILYQVFYLIFNFYAKFN